MRLAITLELLLGYFHQDFVFIEAEIFFDIPEVEGITAVWWMHEVFKLVDGALSVVVLNQAVDHHPLSSSGLQLIVDTPLSDFLLREECKVVR